MGWADMAVSSPADWTSKGWMTPKEDHGLDGSCVAAIDGVAVAKAIPILKYATTRAVATHRGRRALCALRFPYMFATYYRVARVAANEMETSSESGSVADPKVPVRGGGFAASGIRHRGICRGEISSYGVSWTKNVPS